MVTPEQVFVKGGPKDVVVEVGLDVNGQITVTPAEFRVSQEKEEQVVWNCIQSEKDHQHGSGGRPCFTVAFNDENGSPFSDWHFQNHRASSGPVRREVKHGSIKYKYTINMHGKKLDPTGVVDR